MFKVIVTKDGEEVFTLNPGGMCLAPAQGDEREHVLSMLVWAMQTLTWAVPDVPIEQEPKAPNLRIV